MQVNKELDGSQQKTVLTSIVFKILQDLCQKNNVYFDKTVTLLYLFKINFITKQVNVISKLVTQTSKAYNTANLESFNF